VIQGQNIVGGAEIGLERFERGASVGEVTLPREDFAGVGAAEEIGTGAVREDRRGEAGGETEEAEEGWAVGGAEQPATDEGGRHDVEVSLVLGV
jgi:hypothetical protein